MRHTTVIQTTLTFVLLAALALLADVYPFWMPDMAEMVALAIAAVLLFLWAGFVMQEAPGDEREAIHRMHAGRAAYLSGAAVLTAALLSQGLSHHIDPWIPAALSAMVVAKLATRLHLERHR